MKGRWRLILASESAIGAVAALYLFTYVVALFFPKAATASFRWILLVICSVAYGAYRVRLFHPFRNERYRRWIEVAPWTFDKPLPVGPVHLVWTDLAVLGVLCSLGYVNRVSNFLWLPALFLTAYLVYLIATFDRRQIQFVTLALFLGPFVFYPHRDLRISVGVLAGIYLLAYFGYRAQFKQFPWNTSYWRPDISREYRNKAIAEGVIGWPYRTLNAYEPTMRLSFVSALALSILATWWLHSIAWVFGEKERVALLTTIMGLVYLPVILRLLAYIRGFWPPIGLFGRIFTLRWVIPGYDKVFVAPLCALLVATGTQIFGGRLGLPLVWRFELGFFVMFFAVLSIPPSLRSWRLVGRHRLVRTEQRGRPIKKTAPFARCLQKFFPSTLGEETVGK